jgi:hypothetical protein
MAWLLLRVVIAESLPANMANGLHPRYVVLLIEETVIMRPKALLGLLRDGGVRRGCCLGSAIPLCHDAMVVFWEKAVVQVEFRQLGILDLLQELLEMFQGILARAVRVLLSGDGGNKAAASVLRNPELMRRKPRVGHHIANVLKEPPKSWPVGFELSLLATSTKTHNALHKRAPGSTEQARISPSPPPHGDFQTIRW